MLDLFQCFSRLCHYTAPLALRQELFERARLMRERRVAHLENGRKLAQRVKLRRSEHGQGYLFVRVESVKPPARELPLVIVVRDAARKTALFIGGSQERKGGQQRATDVLVPLVHDCALTLEITGAHSRSEHGERTRLRVRVD